MTGLYVRDTVDQETGTLDVPSPGAQRRRANRPVFQGASADGTVVFFTDIQRLTADASLPGSETRDLYRCEVGTARRRQLGCTSLHRHQRPARRLRRKGGSPRAWPPASARTESRIYFIAGGVLDTAPNEAGDTALAEEPNLYLWEEGQGRRFVATLSERDRARLGPPGCRRRRSSRAVRQTPAPLALPTGATSPSCRSAA